MQRFLVAAAIVLAVIAVVGAAIVMPVAIMVIPWTQNSGERPTDEAMMAHWRANRAAFEQLAAMMTKDEGLKRLGKDWSEPADLGAVGVSPNRAALYRKLFDALGIKSASQYGSQVRFVYFASGLLNAGSAKSFCYGPPPTDFVDQVEGDLDAASKDLRDFRLQRRIEGDWWLQYDGT